MVATSALAPGRRVRPDHWKGASAAGAPQSPSAARAARGARRGGRRRRRRPARGGHHEARGALWR